MQTTHSASKDLPSIRCSREAVVTLAKQLLDSLSASKLPPNFQFAVRYDNREVAGESIDELSHALRDAPSRSEVRLRLLSHYAENSRSCYVDLNYAYCRVSANSHDEFWLNGAIAALERFGQTNRVWYYRLSGGIGALIFTLALCVVVAGLFALFWLLGLPTWAYSWTIGPLFIILPFQLGYRYTRVFRHFTLEALASESLTQSRKTEIAFWATVLGAVVGVVSLILALVQS